MSSYIRGFWRYLGKNETAKGLFLVGIVLLSAVTIWYGISFALNTSYPVLVVSSGSMVPTLQVGDLIVIRGQDPSSIKAGPPPIGSIIVFKPPCCSPEPSDPNYLVVHRVVRMNGALFVTQGDHNGGQDDLWDLQVGGVPASDIVGVYQYTIPIPYAGTVILTIRSFMYDENTGQPKPEGIAVIVALIAALFALEIFEPPKKKTAPSTGASDVSPPSPPPRPDR